MKTGEFSKAQMEVWEWKESINKRYEHLEAKDALRKIMIESIEITKRLNMLPSSNNMEKEEIKSARDKRIKRAALT